MLKNIETLGINGKGEYNQWFQGCKCKFVSRPMDPILKFVRSKN